MPRRQAQAQGAQAAIRRPHCCRGEWIAGCSGTAVV